LKNVNSTVTGSISLIKGDIGKIFSSSSITIQFLQSFNDNKNLSLNLG